MDEAIPLYRAANDQYGQAQCTLNLGRVEALTLYEEVNIDRICVRTLRSLVFRRAFSRRPICLDAKSLVQSSSNVGLVNRNEQCTHST
jgi:hypothetical protein